MNDRAESPREDAHRALIDERVAEHERNPDDVVSRDEVLAQVHRALMRLPASDPPMPEDVLKFWFEEIEPKQWWKVDAAFDDLVRRRFETLLRRAAQGELYAWRTNAKGRLAEVIVLDQFSRNIHRGKPAAFAQDPMALALAQEAVAAGAHEALAPIERTFLLMPYMHSESRLIHVEAEALFRQFAPPDNYDFEVRHKAIVDRFGRYPHRNAILGRASTPEELEFLKQPGSSF